MVGHNVPLLVCLEEISLPQVQKERNSYMYTNPQQQWYFARDHVQHDLRELWCDPQSWSPVLLTIVADTADCAAHLCVY